MSPPTGATPLFALDAVSIDIETTSLDVAEASIVQLGAVRISNGAVLPEPHFDRLVDPGAPIPERSTAVHGIDAAAVRDAPALPDLWRDFGDFLGDRVVIGHSVAFDLSVLAAEAQRRALSWTKPRALCVRMLAMVAAPSLASHSLEALANWLDVETRNRHQALGDAEAAGRIFVALIPLLQKAGVRTLAEAERACLGLAPEMERLNRAGWETPVSEVRPRPGAALSRGFDSYAYRHRVGDVMGKPPVVVTPDTTVAGAMQKMVERAISSVFVAESAEPGLAIGSYAIFTERDALRLAAKQGAAALDDPVGDHASGPLHTIRDDAFLYRSIARMRRLEVRHLGVRSDDDRLVGAISPRDVLRQRADPAIALGDAIDEAQTAADMARAWASLPAVVNALMEEEVEAHIVCEIVSEEIRAMTHRAAVLAIEAMEADGLGGPPCAFAVLVLGSGGRGESMLVPDQDNAVVFESGDPGGPEDEWFAEMGRRMADTLDAAGIPYCKGGVMAKNEAWRGSMATWEDRVAGWVRRSKPEDLLNVDIFFDAAPVLGVSELGRTLMDRAFSIGGKSPEFAKLLGESLASVRPPISLFGGFRTDDGRLDLKIHALFPIVAAARTLAIRHGVPERATRARLHRLTALGVGGEADMAAILEAHALCQALLLKQQSRDIDEGVSPSNRIEVGALSRRERSRLKDSLGRIGAIPTLVRDAMFAGR